MAAVHLWPPHFLASGQSLRSFVFILFYRGAAKNEEEKPAKLLQRRLLFYLRPSAATSRR